VAFGFMVDELEGFQYFSLALGMFWAIANATESAQNYQILSKSVQRQLTWRTLKHHQHFSFFSKNNNFICWRGTKVCVHHLDFQYNNLSYAFFIVKKTTIVCEF
jgi:hypothetical protein